jgi:hypothetical protein
MSFVQVDSKLSDIEVKKGDLSRYQWTIEKNDYFSNIKSSMIDLINVYLKIADEKSLGSLRDKTHYLRVLCSSGKNPSTVELTVASISAHTSEAFTKCTAHRINDYVPFIVFLGKLFHHFGLRRSMMDQRHISEALWCPRHIIEDPKGSYVVPETTTYGMPLFAREVYPTDTAEVISSGKDGDVRVLKRQAPPTK